MYISKGSGLEIYETYEELIDKGVTSAWEYLSKYYVRVKLEDQYDNRIWVVDKESKEISDMYFTDFICDILDDAKPIDPETFSRYFG